MKFTKRVLALLLALCLTFGNVMPVLAAEVTDEETVSYSTVTFVYAGSNAAVTGSLLGGYVTWGLDEVKANADTLGVIYEASGKSLTMKVDSSKITATPVYMDMWAEGTSLTWKGVSTNFSGETIYLLDDGTATTTKPEDSGEEVTYGTVSFVYTGSDATIAAAGWEGWVKGNLSTITSDDGASLTNAGIAASTSGNVVTLTVDKSKVTGDVYLDVYDNATWTHWYFTTQFSGETFYLVDGVSDATTTAPSTEPEVTEPEVTESQTMTPAEIVDAAYALEQGATLDGTHTLTGKIISIDTAYSATYGNITVSMTVEGRENYPIMCFRLAGTGADTLAVGDTITVTGSLTNYNGTIEYAQGCTLDAVVPGEPDDDDPDSETPTASMTADAGNRVSYSTSQQVWQSNGITLTNDKGESTSDVGDYTNPIRLYKSSTVKVEYPGMTKIVFTCAGGTKYVLAEEELSSYGTVTISGYTVTLELTEAADSVEFVTTAQRRVAQIDVYSTGSSVGGDTDPTEPEVTEPEVTEPEVTEPEVTEPQTMTPAEIVDAAYALEQGATLDGTHTLTGKIISIDTAYSETYGNITVSMTVEGRENYPIMCFRLAGTGADTLAVGDTITVTGSLTNYNGTIEYAQGCTLDAVVPGEPDDDDPDSETPTASMTADAGNRVSYSTSQQVWQSNGITLTNDKGESTSDVGDYTNPIRLYKSSTVKVEYPGMTKIVFTCAGGTKYVLAEEELSSYGTVTISGYTVTLELTEAADSVEFVTTAQRRVAQIDVYSTGSSVGGDTEVIDTEEELIAAITAGGEVVVGGDVVLTKAIEISKDVTITAECAVTITTTGVVDAFTVTGGTLTLGENITIVSDNSVLWANGGTININGANVTSTSTVNALGFADNGGSINVNSGSVKAYWTGLTASGEGSAVNVLGGSVESTNSNAILAKNYAVATISGGSITSGGTYVTLWAKENGKLVVDGDATVSSAEGYAISVEGEGTEAAVSAGTFTGPVKSTGTLTITGGSFDSDVSEFLEGSYVQDADGSIIIPAPGHELNPELLTFTWTSETESQATVEVPANSSYFVGISTGMWGDSMQLTIDGVVYGSVSGTPYQPCTVELVNDTDEAVTKTLVLGYAAGHQMNPAELVLGENTASIEAGNSQGYFYTFTVPATGTLILNISAEIGWTYQINNLTAGKYGDAQRSDSEPVVNPAEIEVSEGDELQIMVNTYDPADMWNNPAGTITLNVNYPLGSDLNPDQPTFNWTSSTSSQAAVVVPANTSCYYVAISTGMWGDTMILTIDGEEYGPVSGTPWQPCVIELANDTDEAVTKTLVLTYPVGSQMNPDTLNVYDVSDEWASEADGENIATVEADSWTGYQYYWTAPVAGELTINVSNGKAGWAYTVNNVTGCKYGDSHYSSDVPAQNSETIMVSAGDEIQVVINSCGEAGATSPAGEVYFYATFNPYAGTEENPISVTFVEYDMYWNTVLVPVTVTVPANTTYYYQSYGISGMLLSINGGEGTLLSGGNPRMPVTFSVTNDTEAEAEYTLTVAYPAGNQMNPAELMDYENVAKIEAGSQGYYYTWTAADKGTLTIEISAADDAGWTYVLNNLTTYQYGDTQWSDSDPVVNTATIEVNKGDEIQLIVNTYDPADMWSNPAGTITVYAYAEYDAGTESNPEMVFFNMNDDYLSGWLNVTVPANTTYYYQSYGIGGMYMNVMNADGEQIDGYTLPSVMGRQPVVFSVTNSSDEAAEYILQIYYPIGSQMNPEQVYWTGYCGAYIEEGNSSGYYYQITAQITGSVEIELDEIYPEGVEADIIVFNNTTYSQKTLSADGVDGVLTLDVTAGDVLDVQIVVMPDASWNYPEANILWKYDYVAGTEGNPDWMYLGKNSFKIEANDEDGYYLKGYVEEPGYVTITMTSSNWSYSVGYWKSVYDDEGDEIGRELVWTEVQASNVKGAKKSQTIYLDGGNYFLHINTANGKAATVSFTVTHASKVVEVAAGKPVTLTFTDPSTGKAVSASKATWEITEIYTADDAEDYAAYASVANGKLTTVASAITEPIQIVVKAVLKDGTAENTFQIFVYPAVTSIQINTNKVENDMWVVDEENVTELTYVANGDNDIYLSTVIGPDNALIDVTWKSSNTKILNVYQSYYYDDNGEHQYVGLEYVYNSKTDKIATGTVTLTATANDGSGVKATVKVNVVMETKWVDISTKNDQFVIAPGKSVTMIADLKTWYNQTPTNKAVEWSLGEMIVWNYETNEWETYAPGEGQTPVVTLSNKGVLKAASTADKIYQIQVIATAQDTGVSNYSWMAVMPLAKTVQIYGIPATYNLYSGEEIRPSVEIRDKNGNDCWSGYKWTTSNKKIAEVVAVEEYNEEYDSYYSYYVVNFTGKTGKVTLTATATDGSNVKKAVTVNVVKGVAEVILPETVSVGTGKSVNLNKSVSVNPTDVTNKKVTWSWATDEDKAVADSLKVTLNASGTLSAAKLKTVTDTVTLSVKATAADGLGACGYTTVVIRPATTKVTLYRFHKAVSGTLSLDDDDVMVLHANSLPESAVQEYTWKSSNVKIATVEANPDGSVTVRPTGKLGSVTITATAADGSNKSAKVTVKVVKKVDSLTIADNAGVAATKSLNLNKSLTINPTNASNKKVTWSWGNDASAAWAKDNKVTLSASGTLSAAKLKTLTAPKTLNVKVTAADGFGAYDYASVTIYPATTSVALVNTDGSVIAKTGETVSYKRGSWQMSAVGTPEGVVMDQYKWTSSNVKIATVDQNGLVTFTGKVGSVTIKATATDGTNKYAQTTIKVVKFVESLSWTNDYFLSVAKGKTVTLSKVVSIQPADATNKALVWTMELVEYDAETGAYVTKGDGVVSSKMATLNKSTGALKTVNVSDLEYVRVTCTPADDPTGMNAISQIVVLAPNAIKGIQLLQEQEDGTKVNMAKKTISTTESSVKLYPEATNASTDKPASDWTFTVSNKNFEVLWDGVNMVVRATSDAANPYGTVKVTVKATDGSNVSTYVTIKFVKPVAEATLN